jgi:hypothetical protein
MWWHLIDPHYILVNISYLHIIWGVVRGSLIGSRWICFYIMCV